MVNLNQILLNFFPPPPYLLTDAERIIDACLPFRKNNLVTGEKQPFLQIYLLVIFLER